MNAATITALCVAVAGVLTAAVALVHSLQQAGVLKDHLATHGDTAAAAAPPVPGTPPAGGAG